MTYSYQEKLQNLRETLQRLSPEQAKAQLDSSEKPVLLDVREADEFREGHLPGALHLARGFLELQVESLLTDRRKPLILYCAGGIRSLFATETLSQMGYQNVASMDGGFAKWKELNFPIEQPPVLSERDRARYKRHLAIPEVGEKGQLKLLGSKVLMIGAGGLGCPAAYYLAAAGVGKIGIVDADVVERSNLQRQILHPDDRVGVAKVSSAQQTLAAFNPDIEIQTYQVRLTSDNVEDLFEGYDLIVDGTDNFPTRYLINDACVKFGLPCVHGSVYRFEGQVTLFDPKRGGPCYRCLYPEPPPPEMAPSCAEAGVLGVLPGLIGLMQAVETVKYLLDIGNPLIGRMLHYHALEGSFSEYELRKDPDCCYCGEGKPFPGYIDYAFFCANPAN